MTETLVKIKEVTKRLGVGRTTLYKNINQGLCTKPIKLTGHAVAWAASEISVLVAGKIAGLDDDAMRLLVKKLHAKRAEALVKLGVL